MPKSPINSNWKLIISNLMNDTHPSIRIVYRNKPSPNLGEEMYLTKTRQVTQHEKPPLRVRRFKKFLDRFWWKIVWTIQWFKAHLNRRKTHKDTAIWRWEYSKLLRILKYIRLFTQDCIFSPKGWFLKSRHKCSSGVKINTRACAMTQSFEQFRWTLRLFFKRNWYQSILSSNNPNDWNQLLLSSP